MIIFKLLIFKFLKKYIYKRKRIDIRLLWKGSYLKKRLGNTVLDIVLFPSISRCIQKTV